MINSSTAAVNSIKLYRRTAIAFVLLVFLPFMLSLINLTFAQSWKVHFFPAAIILAALIFGAAGGFVAGIAGSLYSAFLLGNPYLIIGNALFGLLTGIFYKKTCFSVRTSLVDFNRLLSCASVRGIYHETDHSFISGKCSLGGADSFNQ